MIYTKNFRFRRLPAVQADPEAWRRHALEDFPEIMAWQVPPQSPDEAREVTERFLPDLAPELDVLLEALSDQGPTMPRILSCYNPPPFFAGCSVTVARREDRSTMLRNYDMGPDDFSPVIRFEELPDGGWIIGSADCVWGYMDGLNHRGLAVAITFGGRFVVGDGFGIMVTVRDLLRHAGSVEEAVERLKRFPHRLCQNLILLDRTGRSAVAYVSPDRGVIVEEGQTCATNHQQRVEEPGHAQYVQTLERFAHLQAAAGSLTLADLMRPPLYNQRYTEHFGTVYSVELDPVGGTARYAWPGREFVVGSDTAPADFTVTLQEHA